MTINQKADGKENFEGKGGKYGRNDEGRNANSKNVNFI